MWELNIPRQLQVTNVIIVPAEGNKKHCTPKKTRLKAMKVS